MTNSRIIKPMYESTSLRNNALSDPVNRPIQIYLPPGYDNDTKHYPVAYLLAGFVGTGLTFMNHAAWDENIQLRLDRLISSGVCKPMIVVMPDCFTRYGGSQYLNSTATGNYRSYLLEIVTYVDQHFRTVDNRESRAILGKSSGGYGALMTALHHPEIFGLVADHSGDKFFEKCYAKELLELPNLLTRWDITTLLADPAAISPKTSDFFQIISIAAMAACYSPNPDSELGFDWPVDTHTGELKSEIWNKWIAQDPIHILENHLDALSSFNLLFFDCGNRDEYFMHFGCRLMEKRLIDNRIPHIYEEFDGGHRQTLFRYDRSFSAISNAFPA